MAVFGDDRVLRDLLDRSLLEMDVWKEERLQIAFARGDSATAKLPFGNQLFTQICITVQLPRHMIDCHLMVLDVFVRALDELEM